MTARPCARTRRWLAIVAATLGLIAAGAGSTGAQTRSVEWMRLDTDITVLDNGDLRIVETNVIRFNGGPFSSGFREIEMNTLDSVSDVRVTEAGRPLQSSGFKNKSGYFQINYSFSPATNQERAFVLSYLVKGATRYYNEGDEVFWSAVYADREGAAVRAARSTVRLPERATATDAFARGVEAAITGKGGRVVEFESRGAVPNGTAFEVGVSFPHGVISGSAPAWQRAYDSQQAYDERFRPFVDGGLLAVALALLFGGPAALAYVYVTRGRDPNVGLVAEYLTEPPALAPGLAGTLVDERADMKDIVATVVDLARRGALVLQEEQPRQVLFTSQQRFSIARGPAYTSTQWAPHESTLVAALGLSTAETVTLDSLTNKFYVRVAGVQKALYQQLVNAGLYERSPDLVRNRYSAIGGLLVFAAFAAVFAAAFLAQAVSVMLACLPVALGVLGAAALIVAQHMPVRTRAGADLRMRTEAFRRYLQTIERHADLKAASEAFDRYLPYAIAFGIDRTWVRKFGEAGAPAPVWYVPWSRRSAIPTRGAGSPTPWLEGGAGGGLSGLDKGMTAGLASMSTSLTGMFNAMSSTMNSRPSSSGSGGRSGGSRSFSSGGGRGGFR